MFGVPLSLLFQLLFRPAVGDEPQLPSSFHVRLKWPECESVFGVVPNQGNCYNCWAITAASVLSDRLCVHRLEGLRHNMRSWTELMRTRNFVQPSAGEVDALSLAGQLRELALSEQLYEHFLCTWAVLFGSEFGLDCAEYAPDAETREAIEALSHEERLAKWRANVLGHFRRHSRSVDFLPSALELTSCTYQHARTLCVFRMEHLKVDLDHWAKTMRNWHKRTFAKRLMHKVRSLKKMKCALMKLHVYSAAHIPVRIDATAHKRLYRHMRTEWIRLYLGALRTAREEQGRQLGEEEWDGIVREWRNSVEGEFVRELAEGTVSQNNPASRPAFDASVCDLARPKPNQHDGCLHGGRCEAAYFYAREHGVTTGAPQLKNFKRRRGCNPYPVHYLENDVIDRKEPAPKCESVQRQCTNREEPVSVEPRIRVRDVEVVVPSDARKSRAEELMMREIMERGSISVGIYPDLGFYYYRYGIYSKVRNWPAKAFLSLVRCTHTVRLVGWGEERQSGGKGKKYWIVGNSYDEDWGMDGFGRVARGSNESGIEGDVHWTPVF